MCVYVAKYDVPLCSAQGVLSPCGLRSETMLVAVLISPPSCTMACTATEVTNPPPHGHLKVLSTLKLSCSIILLLLPLVCQGRFGRAHSHYQVKLPD